MSLFYQGQVSAEGILHLANPNLGSNSGMRILESRILGPNSGVEFFGPVFSEKRSPLKNSPLKKFTAQNSHQKIHPRIWAEKFTLHFCRATLLIFYRVEARFHRVCPWDKPGLSLGQSRGRRAAQKVYVKKVYVPFSLAIRIPRHLLG